MEDYSVLNVNLRLGDSGIMCLATIQPAQGKSCHNGTDDNEHKNARHLCSTEMIRPCRISHTTTGHTTGYRSPLV